VGEGAPSFLSPADQEVKAADMPEGPAASHRPQSSGLETLLAGLSAPAGSTSGSVTADGTALRALPAQHFEGF
jgi:hypothetical protein